MIANWHPSSLYFGVDSTGLTASQLAQMRFVDPSGMAPGQYRARILPDGEVVPAPRPTLGSTKIGQSLVLNWEGDYQLLSATNAAGPYTIVPNATSPWTNSMLEPQRFFILRAVE